MQTALSLTLRRVDTQRYLVLLVVLLLGTAAMVLLNDPAVARQPRVPADPALFEVNGWSAGAPETTEAWGTTHVARTYRRADGAAATFYVSTNPVAKSLYRAGADVPFLGNGYTVSAAPAELGAMPGATIAQRENERWLLMHAYGERRGLLGNGTQAWALVGVDMVFRQPNDYYLLRLVVPLHHSASEAAAPQAIELAQMLFGRVAGWYAS